MIYKEGMLCKHFKGTNLTEKNIYKIEQIGVKGSDIDEGVITYTGDNDLKRAVNLVVYSNIFQDGKMFCREYEDISSPLSEENKEKYNQTIKVEPLSEEESLQISNEDFITMKKKYFLDKFGK